MKEEKPLSKMIHFDRDGSGGSFLTSGARSSQGSLSSSFSIFASRTNSARVSRNNLLSCFARLSRSTFRPRETHHISLTTSTRTRKAWGSRATVLTRGAGAVAGWKGGWTVLPSEPRLPGLSVRFLAPGRPVSPG